MSDPPQTMDRYDDLLKKIKSVSNLNSDIIAEIEPYCDENNLVEVTTEIVHKLELTPSGVTIKTERTFECAFDRVYNWKNSDVETYSFDNFFGCDLSLKVRKYSDVKAMHGLLTNLFPKYEYLKNPELFLGQLRALLNDLERVQVALGEIQQLTMSLSDTEIDETKKSKSAKLVTEAFKCLGLECCGPNFTINSTYRRSSRSKTDYAIDDSSSEEESSYLGIEWS